MKLPTLRLNLKLPLMITSLIIASMSALAFAEYRETAKTLTETARHDLEVAAETQDAQIRNWIRDIETDLLVAQSDPSIRQAVRRFGEAFQLLGSDPKSHLQSWYIDQNPFPAGERSQFAKAEDSSIYSTVHEQLHDHLRLFSDEHGYKDLFLIDAQGNLVYSVAKNQDFAANFASGPFSNSNLGRLFRDAQSLPSGKVLIEDFEAYAPNNGTQAGFAGVPIHDPAGNFVGVLGFQLRLETIETALQNVAGLGETGDAYFVDHDGVLRTSSLQNPNIVAFTGLPSGPLLDAAVSAQTMTFDNATGLGGRASFVRIHALDIDGLSWSLFTEVSREEALHQLITVRNKILVFVLGGIALSIVAGLLISRSVTHPISRANSAVQSLSEGDYDTQIDGIERQDEFGALARDVDDLRLKLQQSRTAEHQREVAQQEQSAVITELSASLRRLADGDLSKAIEQEFQGEYATLRIDFNSTIETLNRTVGTVVNNASEIFQRAEEISSSSDDLSRRTENQAATLEETAAALDELTSSVRSAATGAAEVESVVNDARSEAEDSGKVVRDAVTAMSEIKRSSDEISQIIGVIDDIAFQTNLLALNAGVEAARAGDAGKGFAVVASEVRALAQRSSDAAKQIKGLIGSSSDQVESGVSLVGQAGDALTKIVDRVTHIASLVSTIAAGAKEQSTGLNEINVGVTQLDQVTQQNAAMVEQSTAAAHALREDASQLRNVVAGFQLQDSRNGDVTPFPVPMRAPENEIRMTMQREMHAQLKATGTDDGWQDF